MRSTPTTDDIFTGGGSKDTQGIQDGRWLFTDSKPQAKNDITHAYAAAYTDPDNGHLILYVGLDRFDNSGDATVGFWFFRNQIGLNPDVTTKGGHPFVGAHADGDILLVSDFTQGGSTSTIKVFQWVGDDSHRQPRARRRRPEHHLRDRERLAHLGPLVVHEQERSIPARGRGVLRRRRGPDRPGSARLLLHLPGRDPLVPVADRHPLGLRAGQFPAVQHRGAPVHGPLQGGG